MKSPRRITCLQCLLLLAFPNGDCYCACLVSLIICSARVIWGTLVWIPWSYQSGVSQGKLQRVNVRSWQERKGVESRVGRGKNEFYKTGKEKLSCKIKMKMRDWKTARHQELCRSQREAFWRGGDICLLWRGGAAELIQSFFSLCTDASILLEAAGFGTVNARLSREWWFIGIWQRESVDSFL